MNISNNKIYFIIILFSILILLYPTYQNVYFDGLQLNKKFEHFTIFIFLPVIFLLKLKSHKVDKLLIILLIILKLFFIFSPNKGITLNQFLLIENNKEIKVKNVDGFWNDNFSSVIFSDLNIKNQFPIEWINYYDPNSGLLGDHHFCEEIPDICNGNFPNIKNFKFKFVLNSKIILNESSKFYIRTNGAEFSNLKLYDENEKIYKVKTYKKLKNINVNELPILSKGIYNLKGTIIYKGQNLSFIPYLYVNNKLVSAFEKEIFYQKKINKVYAIVLSVSSFIFNIVFVLLLISFLLKIVCKTKKNIPIYNFKYFYLISLIFVFVFLFNKYFTLNLLNLITLNSSLEKIFSGSFILALYVFIIATFFYFNCLYKKKYLENNLYNFYIIFILLISLIFFYLYFEQDIQNFKIMSQGDDWHVLQYYSYRIVALGEYLRAGEDVIAYRPLARYLFALLHLIFGQSFFSHIISDVWCILLSGYLIIKILEKNKIKLQIGFLISSLLIFFYFGETFKFLIGRGLSAFYASFSMILLCYYVHKFEKNISFLKVLFLGIIGIIGILFREDHILAIYTIGLIILLRNKINFSLIFSKKLYLLFFYFVLLFFGFSLIFIRNYYVSGQFFYGNNILHPNFTSIVPKLSSLSNIYTITMGSELPLLPRTMSIFLLSSFILSIFFFLKKEITNNLLFYSLIVISIVLPYFVAKVPGYQPRLSVHMLPFSMIFLTLYFYKPLKKLFN